MNKGIEFVDGSSHASISPVQFVGSSAPRKGTDERTDEVDRLAARLRNRDGVLSRTDLRKLGWPRRGIDAVFRGCPNIYLPGYSRPVVLVRDYLAFLEANTYDGDRVR